MNSVEVFWWLVLMGGFFGFLAIAGAIEELFYYFKAKRNRKRKGATYV